MKAQTTTAGVPQGFVLLEGNARDGFMDKVGPFYARRGDGPARIGVRIEHHHCNSMGVCHGGMVATLCDAVLGFTIAEACGTRQMLTVSLNTDFVGPVLKGCWFEGWGEVLRIGGALSFARAELYADGKVVARTSGIFKLVKPKAGA